jgi:hypothetical protein
MNYYLEGGRVIHCAMRVEGNALLRNYLFSERVAVPPIGIEPMTFSLQMKRNKPLCKGGFPGVGLTTTYMFV